VFRKPVVTPKSPMRPLYWTRICVPSSGVVTHSVVAAATAEGGNSASVTSLVTMWEELEEAPLEVDEFDQLFSRPVMQPRAKKKEKKEEDAPKKMAAAKYFDTKRSQDIGIFIKSKHLEMREVENAIYNLDNSIIDFETLKQIRSKKETVTAEELDMLKSHAAASAGSEDTPPLDEPEQFILDLSSISNFDERLECFMFQSKFADAVGEVENRLNNVNHVCEQLTNSAPMKEVFGVILSCGNYMNGGNRQRGQADGFAIDILPKLKDVKSKDNTINLLQYVVRFWIVRYDPKKGTPEATSPVPEASDVDRSSHINFDEQHAECERLRKELEGIEEARDKVVEQSDEEHMEPFRQKMETFLSTAAANLGELEQLVVDSRKKFLRTMRYYKFAPKESGAKVEDAQPKDFFALWHLFCQDFKNLWKKEQARIEKEMLKEERLRHRQKKESLKSFEVAAVKPRGLKDKMLRKKSKLQQQGQRGGQHQ